MKKSILKLTFIFFLATMKMYSQSLEDKKIHFKSISLGFGICAGSLNKGGVGVYIDATTVINKNLLSVYGSIGG